MVGLAKLHSSLEQRLRLAPSLVRRLLFPHNLHAESLSGFWCNFCTVVQFLHRGATSAPWCNFCTVVQFLDPGATSAPWCNSWILVQFFFGAKSFPRRAALHDAIFSRCKITHTNPNPNPIIYLTGNSYQKRGRVRLILGQLPLS